MSLPPWLGGTETQDREPLPAQADVVIIGGGPAGLSCAASLARTGAETVLIESRPEGAPGGAGRASGIIVPGLAESAHRLLAVLGEEDCRCLFELARRSLDRLESLGVLDRSGVVLAALSADEAKALEQDLECYGSMGWRASKFTPETTLRDRAIGPGCLLEQAGSIDPASTLVVLADEARRHGTQLHYRTQALDVLDIDEGLEVQTSRGSIRADLVVHTCGWSLVEWLPWAREKLYPVRLQHLCLEARADGLEHPMILQYGHSWARPMSHGLLTGGCRWASPHLEVGERDETQLSEAVERRVVSRAAALFGTPANAAPTHRWAQIATYSCDGLPFVGALPGSARQVVCTGWNGRPWSMALAAGASVAAGITNDAPVELPRCLSSYRMI